MSQSVVVDQNLAKSLARSCKTYIEEAMGEMAYQFEDIDDLEFDFPKQYKQLRAMGRKRPSDWQGWLADEIYNDTEMVRDMAADKLGQLMHDEGLSLEQDSLKAYGAVVAGYFTHLPGFAFNF